MSFSFAGAKTASKTATGTKKSTMAERAVEGIEAYAALETVINSLTAIQKDLEGEIKAFNAETFVALGCKDRRKPDTFRGTENGSSAECGLRKRSSRSALTEEEQKLCDELGVAYKTVDTFKINEDHYEDAKVMTALEKLIGDAIKAGKLPSDIIKYTGSTICHDNALEVLFASAEVEVATQALSLVGTLAVGKAKFNGSLEQARVIVAGLTGEKVANDTGKRKRA